MKQQNISAILLTICTVTACHVKTDRNARSDSPVPVAAVKAAEISTDKTLSLSGNIEGNKTVRLGFLVAGRISSIAAEEGQMVYRDRILATLDPVNYEIAKEMADIQVNQVQDEYDRLKTMHDRNSLSESDFAKITFGLQQARAQQKLQAKNLAETRIYSPMDGILLKKLAEAGEITGVGIPLFVVSDIHKIKVNAFVPENELHDLHIGQKAKVYVSSLDKTYEGKITEVGAVADASSRAFSVKIEVDNPGMLIRPGMIAEVAITSGKGEKVLAVPAEAVMHDYDDQSYVYVADTVKNKSYKRMVSPGKILDNKIEITSGLHENELVITGGQQKVVDGSDIIINK